MSPFSLYKNQQQPKGCKPCLACPVTRGATIRVHLGYGELIWLCPDHASRDWRLSRTGRDFRLTIAQQLESAGALTQRRHKALDRFLATDAYTVATADARARPGSYAWAELRRAVELLCSDGRVTMRELWNLVERACRSSVKAGWMTMPSLRTVRRWRSERRWELPGWSGPARALPRGV